MNKTTVLCIEKNRNTAFFVKELLEKELFEVSLVLNRKEVLKQCKDIQPNILLLNIETPNGFNLELIRTIRRVMPIVPIIVYGSSSDTLTETRIIRAGADDYLKKNTPPALLLARIDNVLRRIPSHKEPDVYQLSEQTIFNHIAGILQIKNKQYNLRPKESLLLSLLCARLNYTTDIDYLIFELWGLGSTGKEHALRKLVVELRKKLTNDPSIKIINKRGEAYLLVNKDEIL